MGRWRAALARLAVCVIALSGAGAASAQPIRQGGEFQVNAYTTNTQSLPSVAVQPDGDFVVTFTSAFDGYLSGVFGHRFDSAGARVGIQFQINTYTTYAQHRSSVASESNGDFVVVWQSNKQNGGVPAVYGVFGQRFTSAATPVGAEFAVNTFTANDQESPRVAADEDGDFIVVWQSTGQDNLPFGFGIFAQRFDSSGARLGGEFQVNARTLENQKYPAVAAKPNGDFVITWQSNQQEAPGSSYGVFARRYSSAGVALATEFQVNTYTVGAQGQPGIAARADGDFVIAWNSFNQESPGSSTGNYGIFARRFTSAGTAQAVEFQVNVYTINRQRYPNVATDDTGDFVVTWESLHQDGDYDGIFARRVASNRAFGPEFQVNSYTADGQDAPVVDFDSDNDFVIVWYTEAAQDGSSYGIFAQRFKLPPLATIDVDGNGLVTAFGDGLLIVKHLIGLTGANLASGGLIDAVGCSRCDASDVGTYIESIRPQLDVDGNGSASPFSDGLLIVKQIIGLTGPNLVSGGLIDAVGCTPPRCDATGVANYIESLKTPVP